jgi:hypothetical protein
MPTGQRLKLAGQGDDHQLSTIYFQMGRYMTIAGSRPGSHPLNLQGKWNDLVDPNWESKHTLNVNQFLNYSGTEMANLSECHQADDGHDRRPGRHRRARREQHLLQPGLGRASQHRPLARRRSHQRARWHLARRASLARAEPLVALPIHRRHQLPRQYRVSLDERRGGILPGFSHPARHQRQLARDLPVVFLRTQLEVWFNRSRQRPRPDHGQRTHPRAVRLFDPIHADPRH